jgi:hypothetical protein
MERLIFREEQSFRQTFVPWLMLAIMLFVLAFMGIGFYRQLHLRIPFGDNPMSNSSLIWSGIITFAVLVGIFIFLINSHLITEIWSDGIRYKFPPLLPKFKYIPCSEITSANVVKYQPVFEFGGWGWRKRFLTRKTAYNVSGNIGIRVVKKDGSQILFGTRCEKEMQRAVETMLLPGK